MIYLDHNATSPMTPAVRAAMEPWFGVPANPMAMHRFGREAQRAVDVARGRVAARAGVRREQVFFTSGATEANTTVLSRGRWAVSAVEHPSVRVWGAVELPVDENGLVRLVDVDGVDGVSVQLANNETGVVQPIAEVVRWAHARGLLVHVDAAQGPGRIPLECDADFVTLSAHKAGGPAGVGALVARRSFTPLLRGGPQERTLRAGTHNVAGIVGFGQAMADAEPIAPRLRDRLEAALGGRVAGAGAPRLPQTTCVAFEGVDAQDLVIALDLEGVAASVGSACASGSPEPSHVLRAMGFAGSATRFSLGPATSEGDVDRAGVIVQACLARLRAGGGR